MAPARDLTPRLCPPPRYHSLADVVQPAPPAHIRPGDLWDAPTFRRVTLLVRAAGLAITDDPTQAKTVLYTSRDLSGDGWSDTSIPHVAMPEAYRLIVDGTADAVAICLAGKTAAALGLASRTLAQLWGPEGLATGQILDWPGCPVRGVIEGFYGQPWTPDARAGMVRFLGAQKFNTFVYGPKDDLYHRGFWRDPYPADALAAVLQQVEQCAAEGLRFVYSLGPGLDIQYSSDADVQQILTKYRVFFDRGVRHFGLYFDDIPFAFLNEADIAKYGEATRDDITPLGVAQAEVTRTVFDTLRDWDPACTLIFCPVEYWGDCESGYVRALRDGLPAEVDVFYTGPDICSPRLETAHTRRVSERFGRPVIFWDNYPVNDAAMTGRLHTNPVVGRDPDLFTAARGLISNPMTQCEASKIALGTIGAYLWAPDMYDPAQAMRLSLGGLVEADEVEPLERFAENMHFCCLHESESERLRGDIATVQESQGGAGAAQAEERLLSHVAGLTKAARACAELSNVTLRMEMQPWVEALAAWTEVCRRAVEVLHVPPGTASGERAALEASLAELHGVKAETCGTVVAEFARWALERTA